MKLDFFNTKLFFGIVTVELFTQQLKSAFETVFMPLVSLVGKLEWFIHSFVNHTAIPL